MDRTCSIEAVTTAQACKDSCDSTCMCRQVLTAGDEGAAKAVIATAAGLAAGTMLTRWVVRQLTSLSFSSTMRFSLGSVFCQPRTPQAPACMQRQ